MSTESLCQQAIGLHQQGNLTQAESLYRRVLAAEPFHVTACHHLGMIRAQKGDYAGALGLMDAALAAQPGAIMVLVHRGNVLSALDRPDEALASHDKALAIDPDSVEALFNRANALYDLKRFADALAGYYRTLVLRPDFAEALNNRGNTLRALGNLDEARESYSRALAVRAEYVEALYNRGSVSRELMRSEEALADFELIVAITPGHAEALRNRGNLLQNLNRYEEALASYDEALAINAADAGALNNRGSALRHLNRFADALASYDQALAIEPDNAMALHNRGILLWTHYRRLEAAITDLEKAVRINPDHDYERGDLLHLKMHGAIWHDFEREKALVEAGVRAGKPIAKPFTYLAISESPADLQACATIQARHLFPAATALWKKPAPRHAKILVGYVSGEFRNQATAFLTAGLYEAHDKRKFEIVAFDNGWNDNSPVRQRMEAAFDKFVDISGLSDHAAAEKILEEEIDILVNLNGYFGSMRMGVFAHRPAPIQVNYLGFPGTLGVNYMDYIIADRFVIPPDEQQYYTEKVVTLPDSYQINDSRRPIAQTKPSRSDHGLPETAFVFCSFNNSYKLTPDMFALWMRILKQVEGSVLWLLESNAVFPDNIRCEAARRGVTTDRLVFAPRLPVEEHLARLKLGDLFLDTLPCNAHTTASDALWAGLPLITCRGNAFPGRAAASLLHAMDLPELIAEDLEAYEALALNLAGDPALLKSVREKLARNRLTAPLFDTDRSRRHIEAAYTTMWEILQRGENPRGFNVTAEQSPI